MGTGYLVAQAYTSRGRIPVEDVSVSVLNEEGGKREIRGFRSTDLSGITTPIALQAPDRALSQQPSKGQPFASYTLQADHPLYSTIRVENIQIYDGQTSVQNLELIPLEENSDPSQRLDTFPVTPPNL